MALACERGAHSPIQTLAFPGDRYGGVPIWVCAWCNAPLYAVPA